MRYLPLLLAATIPLAGCATYGADAARPAAMTLEQAVAVPTRTAANIARDRYRNPVDTLRFFGVRPTDTVVELWPGGGWYTEILAPYLATSGRLIVAAPQGRYGETIARKLDADAATYGKVGRATFPMADGVASVPAGTADVVLTFRNIHSWARGDSVGAREGAVLTAMKQAYDMLKPGGTFGIVEHRMAENGDVAREHTSGYVRTSTVRRLAEQAGFRFVGASEVNANPRDTKDYKDGVWTLPPTYAAKDVDRARYEAIGESDRMTLRFVKPR